MNFLIFSKSSPGLNAFKTIIFLLTCVASISTPGRLYAQASVKEAAQSEKTVGNASVYLKQGTRFLNQKDLSEAELS